MREITIPNCLKITNDNEQVVNELQKLISQKSTLILCGENSHALIAKDIHEALAQNCNVKIAILNSDKQNYQAEIIVGIGGGKSLDQAKYIAAQNQAQFISVPTLISHDGICSPVSVIDGDSKGAIMPTALIVPLHIIQQAPIKYIQAGIGDLIANLSALEDWQLANKHQNENLDDFAIMLSKKACINILQKLSLHKKQNPDDSQNYLCSVEFLTALVESMSLSGIAMSIAGNSRPCSGAEHMISHAIDQIYGPGKIAQHGIQVAVATLYLEQFRKDKFISNNHDLGEIIEYINAPSSFADLDISNQDLEKIIELAPQTRKNRFTILDLENVKPQAMNA